MTRVGNVTSKSAIVIPAKRSARRDRGGTGFGVPAVTSRLRCGSPAPDLRCAASGVTNRGECSHLQSTPHPHLGHPGLDPGSMPLRFDQTGRALKVCGMDCRIKPCNDGCQGHRHPPFVIPAKRRARRDRGGAGFGVSAVTSRLRCGSPAPDLRCAASGVTNRGECSHLQSTPHPHRRHPGPEPSRRSRRTMALILRYSRIEPRVTLRDG